MSFAKSFEPGVAHELGHYVYLLVDRRNGGREVFYVGKGKGSRAQSHLDAARKASLSPELHRRYPKLSHMRRIGLKNVGVEILRYRLRDDKEALAVEAAAIDLLGLTRLKNLAAGHGADRGRKPLEQINATLGALPISERHLRGRRLVLIRVPRSFQPGDSGDDLYEAVRKWWVIGVKRRELGGSPAPEWAAAVHGGVIYAVYRVEGWRKRREYADGRRTRWGFHGRRDSAVERDLVNKDVSAYLPQGAQFPLRFINC